MQYEVFAFCNELNWWKFWHKLSYFPKTEKQGKNKVHNLKKNAKSASFQEFLGQNKYHFSPANIYPLKTP